MKSSPRTLFQSVFQTTGYPAAFWIPKDRSPRWWDDACACWAGKMGWGVVGSRDVGMEIQDEDWGSCCFEKEEAVSLLPRMSVL